MTDLTFGCTRDRSGLDLNEGLDDEKVETEPTKRYYLQYQIILHFLYYIF